jgi:glycosyltransferase involved in cell wall biosynthesis
MTVRHLKVPNKIGYVWQYEAATLPDTAATALHIEAVAKSLEQRAHRVRFVTLRNGQPAWSDDRTHWHQVELSQPRLFSLTERVIRGMQARLHLPFIRFFDSFTFSRAVAQATRDCFVLYERFWFLGYGGLLAAKRLGIPLIYEINGDLVAEYEQLGIQLSRAQWAAIHLVTRLMFHYADHLITVSDALREKTIERWHVHPDKVTTVPNGAHVDLFAEDKLHEVLDARYHLNGNPTIMFVGSFKPWHGLDLLLDAFGQVAAVIPEARLFLVGDGPVRAELEAKAKDLHLDQQVIFTGRVPHHDVAALLQSAHIAVVNPRVSDASRAQSPLKLFEYMAAGKAIVAPKIPTIEQILTDGVSGLLVPPNDEQAVAEAFLKLLQDQQLRVNLGFAAKELALKKHSWDRTAAEIEGIMSRLLTSTTTLEAQKSL